MSLHGQPSTGPAVAFTALFSFSDCSCLPHWWPPSPCFSASSPGGTNRWKNYATMTFEPLILLPYPLMARTSGVRHHIRLYTVLGISLWALERVRQMHYLPMAYRLSCEDGLQHLPGPERSDPLNIITQCGQSLKSQVLEIESPSCLHSGHSDQHNPLLSSHFYVIYLYFNTFLDNGQHDLSHFQQSNFHKIMNFNIQEVLSKGSGLWPPECSCLFQ